jgi:signal transduction histidine kinase
MNDSEIEIDYETVFDLTTDAMVLVDVDGGDEDCRIRAVNCDFERAFDSRGSAVRDEPLTAVLDFETDEPLADRLRTGDADEAVTVLTARDEDIELRGRCFEDGDETRALVVVTPTSEEWSAEPLGLDPGDGSIVETMASMARAGDATRACEDAARLLLDSVGFDAFVADLDGGPIHAENVERPIPVPGSGDHDAAVVRHDVEDRRNDERWGTVVHCPLHGDGVLQVAVHTELSVDDDVLAESLRLFARYFESVLDGLDRDRSSDAEREELVMFNRILRHETLNSLNLIQARLSLFEDDVSSDNRKHYDTVEARVSELIDRVEAIREIRTDEATTNVDRHELAPMLRKEVDRAAEQYPNASFTVVGPVPDVEVAADDRLGFCLQNVLRNAVQHADVDVPEVRVAASRRDDQVWIHVADNGPGIPDSAEDSIFGLGVTSREGSHGEGLFLTARIVEDIYGGSVDAVTSERGGVELRFELPVADE